MDSVKGDDYGASKGHRLWKLVPFVKAEHDGWPAGGYVHPRGLNRHARRGLMRRISSGSQRMAARRLRRFG